MTIASFKCRPWMQEKQEKRPLFFAGSKIEEKNESFILNSSFYKRKRMSFENNFKIMRPVQLDENFSTSLNPDFPAIRIFLETFSSETTPFIVKTSNLILDLKTQIQHEKGILPEKQNLFSNGELLENERTIGSYNLQNDSIIHLSFESKVLEGSMQIFLDYCGKISTLNIAASDTIQKIKYQITDKTKIPFDYQILKHSGRILDNRFTASFYNIEKESTIFLSTRILAKKFVFFSQPR